ncbi:MAG TPA: asparagine synthase-related protein, partial [Beutenbergiaceae bacterium]|nr:asparagine synthase-related protein [Beutenbergiaceae bacterium]
DYITGLWGSCDAGGALDRMTFVDLNTYLPGDILPKVEVTTAAEDLTPYSPFLTASFVDWSATLSHEHKLHEGSLKHVLKVAMDPWLPSELIYRKKQGFGVPLHTWFQREWAPLLKEVASQSYGVEHGWWNKRELDRMVHEQIRGVNHSARLYTIVMLELWAHHATRAKATV